MVVPLALVDVELFVSTGAPRSAFTVRPTEPGPLPSFDVDVTVLLRHGWTLEVSGSRPPLGSDGYLEPPPHPYDLGPRWTGGNCWRADFGNELSGIGCRAAGLSGSIGGGWWGSSGAALWNNG